MNDWFESLQKALSRDSAAVLVTVVAVDGSVPREVGATLVVSVDGTDGTIGGGNLEYSCISQARAMLSVSQKSNKKTDDKKPGHKDRNNEHGEQECRQLSLGPSLGQCCGGRVELLFERVGSQTGWVSELTSGHGLAELDNCDSEKWLFRQLDNNAAIIATPEDFQKQVSISDKQTDLFARPGAFTSTGDDNRWFCMRLREKVPTVSVYGAGHVGQAVVAQLSLMACKITWLDHREDWLELQPDLMVNRVLTDSPEDEISKTPADACHVVMTHSHAIDFDICHAVLKHGHFSYLGLIGSETKRRTFTNRLKHRGHDDDLTDRMRCPIGNLQLESSLPSVIALNLAAELAFLWQ